MHRQARADKREGPACDRTEQEATTAPVRGGSGEDPRLGWAHWAQVAHRRHTGQLGEAPKASNQHTLGSGLARSKDCSEAPAAAGTQVNLLCGTRLPN